MLVDNGCIDLMLDPIATFHSTCWLLSCRARYAMRAILDLSLVYGEVPVKIHDIA